MVDEEEVAEALGNVIDSELGLDFGGARAGVRRRDRRRHGDGDIHADDPRVPDGRQVSEQMQGSVGEIEGVEEVVTKVVFTPPWSPDNNSRGREVRARLLRSR